jgi:hypothetical protein
MEQEDNGDVIRRFFEEVFGTGDVGLLDEIVVEDFTLEDLAAHRTFSVDELKETIFRIHKDVPEWGAEVIEQFDAEDSRVVTRFIFSAPPGDDPDEYEDDGDSDSELVRLNGIAIATVAGYKIDRVCMIWESIRAETEITPVITPGEVRLWKWPPWK